MARLEDFNYRGKARVTIVDMKFSANTSAPYLNIQAMALGKDDAELGTVWGIISFDPSERTDKNGEPYTCLDKATVRLEEVFGFDGNYGTVEQQIIGKDCNIDCEKDSYTDNKGITRISPKIKFFNSSHRQHVEFDDEDKWRRDLTSMVGGKFRTETSAKPKPAEDSAAPYKANVETQIISDDDLPF
jgi:hypothetical protein